jgi:hypothetical protein
MHRFQAHMRNCDMPHVQPAACNSHRCTCRCTGTPHGCKLGCMLRDACCCCLRSLSWWLCERSVPSIAYRCDLFTSATLCFAPYSRKPQHTSCSTQRATYNASSPAQHARDSPVAGRRPPPRLARAAPSPTPPPSLFARGIRRAAWARSAPGLARSAPGLATSASGPRSQSRRRAVA